MLYDLVEIDSYMAIMRIIRDNPEQHPSLKHKEIRIYIDCIHQMWSHLKLSDNAEKYYLPEMKFLIYAISCHISHKKRSFLATRLLELLAKVETLQQKEKSGGDSEGF